MRKLLLAMAVTVIATSCATPEKPPLAEPSPERGSRGSPERNPKGGPRGEAAPDFTVTTFEGDRFALAEQRGTPVVLNFWESWWPQCQAEQPHLNQLAEELDREVVFAGVSNNDTVEDGKGYVQDYDVPYAMAHAPEVWDLYGVPYQPVTIVIDADGAIVHRTDGPVTYKGLKKEIQKVL